MWPSGGKGGFDAHTIRISEQQHLYCHEPVASLNAITVTDYTRSAPL